MRVLVLGNGKLGSEIIKQSNWDSLCRKNNKINVSNFDDWAYKLIPYDVIVNCIANTNTYSNSKEDHWDANYKFVSYLVDFCNEYGKKLIHISTDYVYVNSIENAKETDVPVHDGNWYSYTKLLADSYIELKSKDYLICRLSHKDNPFIYDSAWVDVKTNADYTDVISSLVIQLINLDSKGLYNVGTEVKTIYDLAKQTKDVNPIESPINIPKNVTMDISKLTKTISKKTL
jgi:dTDP-4-dehydrorhamnose reductase